MIGARAGVALRQLWLAVLVVAARRDLVRVDLTVIGGLHTLAGLALVALPDQALGQVSFRVLYDITAPVVWGTWFLLVAGAIGIAVLRPSGGAHFAVWALAVPLAVMWMVGTAWAVGGGQSNIVVVFFFAAMLAWYATTSLRLEAPRLIKIG